MQRKPVSNLAHRQEIQGSLHPDIPLNHQMYLRLKTEIEDGLWIGRSDFPSEEDLAAQYGVSVITARKALDRLSEDGFIERSRGKRAQVVYRLEKIERRLPSLYPIGKARPYHYKILSTQIEVAPAEACLEFGLSPGSKLWTCKRVRIIKGLSVSVSEHALPIEIGMRHDLKKLERLPMWLAMADVGLKVSGLDRRVDARFAPPFAASYLGITLHEPVLVYTNVCFDKDGNKTCWTRVFVHPSEPSPREYINYEMLKWSSKTANLSKPSSRRHP